MNHASITGLHSRVLKTCLHWNYGTSIDDFINDVIIRVTSIFINMKLYSLIKINFPKIINCFFFLSNAWKENKLALSVELPLGKVLSSKWIPLWKDLPSYGSITLDEPASRVAAYASGACFNDSWFLEALLKKLTMILFVQRAINFSLDIYIN